MSNFYGGNGADIITPDTVSSGVLVLGMPRKPSSAVDYIFSGGGDDIVAAGGGNDIAKLGTGNDTFIWNPGDGSDFVDGEADIDTLRFNGSNASEQMNIAATDNFAILTRDVAAIRMTLVSDGDDPDRGAGRSGLHRDQRSLRHRCDTGDCGPGGNPRRNGG